MGRQRRTTTTNSIQPAGKLAAITIVAGLLVGCGDAQTADPRPVTGVSGTVPLGELPEPLSDRSSVPAPPTTPPSSVVATTDATSDLAAGPVADAVSGYRVLLIGDTVLASTAPRNGGTMCDVLVEFGWTVEIAAERGRFVEFGHEVLDVRLQPAGGERWDAAALMFGNHFDGDLDGFRQQLEGLLDRLSPRPAIVYTVSEVTEDAVAINEVIRQLPQSHSNALVVDWAAETALDPDKMFDDDGPQLSPAGSEILVLHTVAAMGTTPIVGAGRSGECLPTVFTDDSAIVL